MRIALDDISEKWTSAWRLRAAGIANSIFGRKNASRLSIAHCEIILLAERRFAVNWGVIARRAVQHEFEFAISFQGVQGQQSTALGAWVTSFVKRNFQVLIEGQPTYTLPTPEV